MADCDFDPALLQDFLDGRLDGPGRHRVADHLADCSHCRRLHAAYVALDSMLAALPTAEPPAFLADRVLQGLDWERAPEMEPRELARSAAAVLAVLGAAAAVFAGGTFAPAGTTDGVFGWLTTLGEYIAEAVTSSFVGLSGLIGAWSAQPSTSLAQTLVLLLVAGVAAAATNHLALRRGAS